MNRVPKLRFKEFCGEWEEKKLGEISSNIMYGLNSSAVEFDGENKYIRITDINEINGKFEPNPLTSPSGTLDDNFLVNENDILFARTGASVGKTYHYNIKDGKLYFAGFLIRFHINKANSKFIYYNTLKEDYNKWVALTSMRTGQPGINAEEYKNYKIKLPCLEEQEKIADFLSSVDKKISITEEKLDLFKDYKKGIMQKIFNQELRFKDSNGNDYPEWEEKRLNSIFERITEKNIENNNNVLTISAQYGLISQTDFFNKSVAGKDLTKYYLLHRDDFAYNKSYSAGYPMGAIKRLTKYDKGIVSTLYICFRVKDNNNVSFLEQFFESRKIDSNIQEIAQEGARNHGLLNISVGDFFDITINLPCLEEQEKIADFLSSIDNKIDNLAAKLEDLKEFKKGLLQQVFV